MMGEGGQVESGGISRVYLGASLPSVIVTPDDVCSPVPSQYQTIRWLARTPARISLLPYNSLDRGQSNFELFATLPAVYRNHLIAVHRLRDAKNPNLEILFCEFWPGLPVHAPFGGFLPSVAVGYFAWRQGHLKRPVGL
jgi:hypothetical protein